MKDKEIAELKHQLVKLEQLTRISKPRGEKESSGISAFELEQ